MANKKHRETIDDICLSDKFIRDGITYTIENFPNKCFVFCEAADPKYDTYMARNEKLLNEINSFIPS